MARQAGQVSTPLLENILAQASALQSVAEYQLGPGMPTLLRCAELLRKSKRIVLTGMGASLFACVPMRYTLAAKGIDVSVIETAELLYFLEPLIDRDSVAILVSRSGESIETVKLLDRLDRCGCSTIGVVNVGGSTLAARTTEHILLKSPADELVAIQTYAATVVTLLLLAATYFDDLDVTKTELSWVINQLSNWISQCVSVSETWKPFVDLKTPLYILGRGASLGSVDEGVLLMHEVAKTPATGMSVAQFRHGFVEAASDRVRAVIIGTQPATLRLDRQFALDLMRMGAAVRWIGAVDAGGVIPALGDWHDGIPARFACIFEALPLQMLAYRTAESRGIRPGLFRWASTVTASESGFAGLNAG